MPCLITALTRSANKKTKRKKTNKKGKLKKLTAKTQYLNVIALSKQRQIKCNQIKS